jgi:DNA-directed RNA polymerase subunit RPC12/RpoP
MTRRKDRPVNLPIRPIPRSLRTRTATCPQCGDREAPAIGHWTQRLVYRCPHCRAMFKRTADLPFTY